MAKPNSETNKQATKNDKEQPPKEAFKPSKKARTYLAAPAGADDEAGVSAGEAAFGRVRAELEALPPDEVRRINVYVPAAVAIAVGVLPKLRGLRGAMLALPGGARSLDGLEDYALAALYAHALTLPYGEGETRLRTLLSEATPLRERLLASAELLARFDLFDATHVAAIRSGQGYLDMAQDLMALSALFRASWADVSSKTPVTAAEVERAAELGPRLVEAFGRRQQGTDGAGDPGEAHDRTVRAYTLFFNAYDDCRRAVAFLRWREGDADDFAPTLKPTPRRQRSAPVDEPGGGEPPGAGGEPLGDETPEGDLRRACPTPGWVRRNFRACPKDPARSAYRATEAILPTDGGHTWHVLLLYSPASRWGS